MSQRSRAQQTVDSQSPQTYCQHRQPCVCVDSRSPRKFFTVHLLAVIQWDRQQCLAAACYFGLCFVVDQRHETCDLVCDLLDRQCEALLNAQALKHAVAGDYIGLVHWQMHAYIRVTVSRHRTVRKQENETQLVERVESVQLKGECARPTDATE